MLKRDTPEHKDMVLAMTLHNPPKHLRASIEALEAA